MLSFDYHCPTRIVFGPDSIARLRELVPPAARILLLAGGGSIRGNGVYDQVRASLGERFVHDCFGIEANPQHSSCLRAVAELRRQHCDFVLAVGGGSVLDAAKYIAVAACLPMDADPWPLVETGGSDITKALPLGTVLTLPATGSEMNGNAVISYAERGAKRALSSPHCLPRFSILDPTVTRTLPRRQIANGIVDAFVHVLEQYLTPRQAGEVQSAQAEALLRSLVAIAPACMREPVDLDARGELMWCATQALNGLIACGLPQDWATHMIGHELTALHGWDHARTLSVVLPARLRHDLAAKQGILARYGRRVWDLQGDDAQVAEAAIIATEDFFRSLDMPLRLRDLDSDPVACAGAVTALRARAALLGEDAHIDADAVAAILAAAA